MTLLDICNGALLKIGEPPIPNLPAVGQSGTPAQTVCRDRVEPALNAVLSLYPWRVSRTLVRLAPTTSTPLGGWLYQYTLPAEMIRFLGVYDEAGDRLDAHQIEGMTLFCDESSILVRYTRPIHNILTVIPTHIARLAEYVLAKDLVAYLASKQTIVDPQGFERDYLRDFATAKSVDVNFEAPLTYNNPEHSSWIQSRG